MMTVNGREYPEPYTSAICGLYRIDFDPRRGLALDWKIGDEMSSKPFIVFRNGSCVYRCETFSDARRLTGKPDARDWSEFK